MSDKLSAWCSWAGVTFGKMNWKKRWETIDQMEAYYKTNPAQIVMKKKYR